MKLLIAIALALSAFCWLFFAGCTSTTLYSGGRPIMRTQADCTNISFQGAGVTFHADRLNHSTPTRAGGAAVTGVITATGAAVAAAGIVPGVLR